MAKHEGIQSGPVAAKDTNQLGSQIVREIVIPALAKEVNEGKNFSQLRQVFYSLILATWYKKKIKDSILNKVYSNRNKIGGVNISAGDKDRIYQEYLKAFKKGVYNYIKEEPDQITGQTVPRKYFSGGVQIAKLINPAIEYRNLSNIDFAQVASLGRLTDAETDLAMTSEFSQHSQERELSQQKVWRFENFVGLESFIRGLEGRQMGFSVQYHDNAYWLTLQGKIAMAFYFNDDLKRKYWELASGGLFNAITRRSVMDELGGFLKNKDREFLTDKNIMVIGPGDDLSEARELVKLFPKARRIKVLDVDLQNVLEHLREMTASKDLLERVEIVRNNILTADEEAGKYQLIYCNGTFQSEVFDSNVTMKRAFQRVAHWVKPGGMLIGNIDNYRNLIPGLFSESGVQGIFLRTEKAMISNPFPRFTSKTLIELYAELFEALKAKYEIRNLLRDGPIRQPPFFAAIKRDQKALEEMKQIKGRVPLEDRSYNPIFVDPKDEISIEDLSKGIVTGEIKLPLIYKPDLNALGNGIFRIERDTTRANIFYLTLAYGEEKDFFSEQGRAFRDYFENKQGVSVETNQEENVMRLTIDSGETDIRKVILAAWGLMSQNKSEVMPVYDSGTVESLMPVVLYKPKDDTTGKEYAYETRHKFLGNMNGSEFSLVKKEGREGSFARIGSSAEFSNRTGRSKANKLDDVHMYDPLMEMFRIPQSRKEEFVEYVDNLIQQEFNYMARRLKHAGIILDLKIFGQFDLMWLKETNNRGFPIPVLIEGMVGYEEQLPVMKISPIIGFVKEVSIPSEIKGIKSGDHIHLQFPTQIEETTEVTGVIEKMPGYWESTAVRLTNGKIFNMNYVSEILVDGGKGGRIENSRLMNIDKVRTFLESKDPKLPVTVIYRRKVLVSQNERGVVLDVPTIKNSNILKYETGEGQVKALSLKELMIKKARLFLVDGAMKSQESEERLAIAARSIGHGAFFKLNPFSYAVDIMISIWKENSGSTEFNPENNLALFGDFNHLIGEVQMSDRKNDIKLQKDMMIRMKEMVEITNKYIKYFRNLKDNRLSLLNDYVTMLQSRIDLLEGMNQGTFNVTDTKDLRIFLRDRLIFKENLEKVSLKGNKYSFYSAINNLLNNGSRSAREKHKDEAKVESKVIIERKGSQLIVRVIDNGSGLTQEQLDLDQLKGQRIFILNNSTSREGTGLGTTEAWYAIKDMGGTITAHNRPGGGAEFTIELPIADGAMNVAEQKKPNRTGGIDLNPAQMSIQVKKDGQDFKFNFNGTGIDAAQVTGATFTIKQMTPVTDLIAVLGIPILSK